MVGSKMNNIIPKSLGYLNNKILEPRKKNPHESLRGELLSTSPPILGLLLSLCSMTSSRIFFVIFPVPELIIGHLGGFT